MHEWIREFPGAVTVCDAEGVILELNDRAARAFEKDGGMALVGKDVLDCHPEPARSKLAKLMAERRANSYTTEKNGAWRFVHQTPWYRDGQYAGFVEIIIDIPPEMSHFVRD